MSADFSEIKQKVFAFFRQFDFIIDEDIELISAISDIIELKKGDVLHGPEYNYNYYLIVEGIIHQYFVDSNGEKRTFHFAPEGIIIADLDTLGMGVPSKLVNQAMEKTALFKFDSREYEKYVKANQRLFKLKYILTEKSIFDLYQRLKFLLIMSPEERYEFLLERDSQLIQRLPQKYLAHLIGVTPVSLSRIKSRLIKNKS